MFIIGSMPSGILSVFFSYILLILYTIVKMRIPKLHFWNLGIIVIAIVNKFGCM